MIELIPAIDIIGGKCVRLTQGDYATKREYGEPVEIAREFHRSGFRRLHLVDLDGAKNGRVANLQTLKDIVAATDLAVDFGGGIKTDDDIKSVFDAGATMATVGSIAVKSPDTYLSWLRTYGAEKLILGADVRNCFVSINGWREDTSLPLADFLDKYIEAGTKNVLCTDISRDGMLQGPAIELYAQIMRAHPNLHLIASGGVSGVQDIKALERAGIPAVVFGRAVYEGRINIKTLSEQCLQKG